MTAQIRVSSIEETFILRILGGVLLGNSKGYKYNLEYRVRCLKYPKKIMKTNLYKQLRQILHLLET